jgi:signal transduction histidine kinase
MQKRILFFILVSLAVIQVSLGVISHLIANNIIHSFMQSRLMLTTILGKDVEYVLERNLTRLQDISLSGSVDLDDGDWAPERRALRRAYEYSIFTDGVFLLDLQGNIVLSYPHRFASGTNLLSIPYVNRAMAEQRPLISDVYTLQTTGKKVIFGLVPLKDHSGSLIGLAGGEINPASYMFTRIIGSTPSTEGTCIELIDSHGMIISSNDPTRILTGVDHNLYLRNLIEKGASTVTRCHRCHEGAQGQSEGRTEDVLAFSSLGLAPWGISVREPQSVVYANLSRLHRILGILSVVYLFTGVLLAVGLSRSIVRPVQALTGAARRIGRGNLDEPVEVRSDDEIGALAGSVERMRLRLKDSLDRLRQHSDELERRVEERTRELMKRRKQLASLLRQSMVTQEEERKRIARELHDETSQTVTALGMSLEMALLSLEEGKLTPDMLRHQITRVEQLLDGIKRVIKDLRPPVLDDLGLESAIRWMLDRSLGTKGIPYTLRSSGDFAESGAFDMDERSQLMVFRIVQEAIINIDRHAGATRVEVDLFREDADLVINVEDDGVGFDEELVYRSGGSEGYGLLGMKERVLLLGGRMCLRSRYLEGGRGTRIRVNIPLEFLRGGNGQTDPDSHR